MTSLLTYQQHHDYKYTDMKQRWRQDNLITETEMIVQLWPSIQPRRDDVGRRMDSKQQEKLRWNILNSLVLYPCGDRK